MVFFKGLLNPVPLSPTNHQTLTLLNWTTLYCKNYYSLQCDVQYCTALCRPAIWMCRSNPLSNSRDVSTSAIVNITNYDHNEYIYKHLCRTNNQKKKQRERNILNMWLAKLTMENNDYLNWIYYCWRGTKWTIWGMYTL